MERIDNTQTKDYIAETIRNEILAGNIRAGYELTQEALADVLGVSRMPVREALQTLVQEGFVERLQNRHVRVVALDELQITETFCIIAAAEAEFAERLIDKGMDLSSINDIIVRIDNLKDQDSIAELETEFHNQLIVMNNNKYLEQMFRKLMSGYVSYGIKNLGDREVKVQNLHTINHALKEETGIWEAFRQYYMYYADKYRQRMLR